MDWHKLLAVVGSDRVFIQTHDYPDPDAIASAFAMQMFLSNFGISSILCYTGDAKRISVTTAIEEFNIPIFSYSDALGMSAEDKIILVDGQKYNSNMAVLPGRVVACIDHHPVGKELPYEYTDIRTVGACSSIMADYFFSAQIEIPVGVATMLLYGLHVDTDFLTRGVTDLDLGVFPKLYHLADQKRLEKVETRNLEFADLKAFGVAINSIDICKRTGFAYIPFSCPDALIAQVADFILSLAEVDVAIIYSSREDGLKYSVRSVLPNIHSGYMLSEIMRPYGGGGGHASLAGGFIPRKAIRDSGIDEAHFTAMLRDAFLKYIESHTSEKETAG